MPPRRSSRHSSVAPSVEPEDPPALPAKRKRSQPPDSQGATGKPPTGKENVRKPPSRSRRSTSAAPPSAPVSKVKARTLSRSKPKQPLEDVAETDEEMEKPLEDEEDEKGEEEEEERKPKKMRPSIEAKVKQEKPPSASAGLSNGKVSASQKNTADDDDDDFEEEHSLLDPPLPSSIARSPRKSAVAPVEEPQGPQSRLVIHKMALVNFKSYAGRQEIGPFHKSFSAIVGANGSGKSNTIDALLFVFGYRASKMRQGKLSELIHNSAAYPDLDDCSVEIHFRDIIDLPGPDAFEFVPDSSLVVARQAFKNNTSRYTINGHGSSFKEVQTLLKGRGIDLDHNRFLILQGEVESIAQMKPKGSNEHEDGLLEYLEDIIGTSQYKDPIERAMAEMEDAQEDRADKMNRLRLVEKERDALSSKKKEAVDYLRLQNEYTKAQSALFQWNVWQCFKKEEEVRVKIAKIQADINREKEKNADDLAHLAQLEEAYREREKIYEELRAAAAAATKELSTHEKQAVGLGERCKHANGKVKKLRKTVQDETAALNEAKRTLADSEDKRASETSQLAEHETALEREEKVLEEISESLKDKTQVFRDQTQVKQQEVQPWRTKIDAKEAAINVATSERDGLSKKAEDLQESLQDAREALSTLRNEQEGKAQELERVKSAKSSLQRDFKETDQQLAGLRSNANSLRQKAASARSRFEEAKSSQAEKKTQSSVLRGLHGLRDSGRVKGFHGRLGDLGTIDEKYDIAVTTACSQVNNMVVDTVEEGQACIAWLRSNNVGRASFLVLEKLTGLEDKMKPKPTPENVPRLFDLIRPKDPKFAIAFYKAVSDTLVAENLEQANRIAYSATRRRVVTLGGQIIDVSGTMGGGGQPLRGGMSSKLAPDTVSADTLKSYERESQDAGRQLEQAMQQIQALEARLDELKSKGPNLDLEGQKLTMDIATGKTRIVDAEQRVRDLDMQSKPNKSDQARIAKLDKDISTWSAELDDLRAQAGKIEAEIKELEQKILDIGGSRLRAQQSKVDGLRMQIDLCSKEITRFEVAKSKAERDIQKYEGLVKSNTKSLEGATLEAHDLEGQLEELRGHAEELRENMEQAKEAEENSKDDLHARKAERDKQETKVQRFKAKEVQLGQQLEDRETESAGIIRALEHWKTQADELTLQEIPEDDDDFGDESDDESGAAARSRSDGVKPEPSDEPMKTGENGLRDYSEEELQGFKERELKVNADLLAEKLQRAKPDLDVLDEYKERHAEYLRRVQDLENVTKKRDAMKTKYDGLRKQRLDEFMAGFNTISLKLKEMYQMITLGGNAELELVDSMDPFSEGIIFSVMPPKKSWKNISNLSGGEKTLSSLALVFALHVFKPTPLYFMDEIDAALDFRNVSIVANYIKDRTKNAQFIIISLRNDMFELSQRLIGIYKTANTTKSISINNQALSAAAQ